MFINERIEMSWNPKSRMHYESKGYIFTKYKDKFIIDSEDLTTFSKLMISYACDYCGKIKKRTMNDYNDAKNGVINKDACQECKYLKVDESNLVTYGCHPSNTDEVKEKSKATFMSKYGFEHHWLTEKSQEKKKQTNIDKFGVEHYNLTDEFKEKFKQTSLLNYGVVHPSMSKEVRLKVSETLMKNHGVSNPMKSKSIVSKLIKSLCESGKFQCSKQQRYIHGIIGGELNYPLENVALDIAFPEQKIYVEYNGGGHDLQVKTGNMSREDFNKKEMKRYYFLKRKGWKLIEINSQRDYLPDDSIIQKLISDSLYMFENIQCSSVTYDIDNSTIRIKNNICDYDFGTLRKLRVEVVS